MCENADQPARQIPEFLVLAPDRIAQALQLVRATLLRMEIGPFDMNPEEIRLKRLFPRLLAEQGKGRAHLLVCFSHHRGEHRSDAIFQVKPQRDIIPFRVRAHEIVRLASVIMNVNQPRSENPALAINHARRCWDITEILADRNRGDLSSLGEQGALSKEIRKSEPRILK